jgi:hypothetical protein
VKNPIFFKMKIFKDVFTGEYRTPSLVCVCSTIFCEKVSSDGLDICRLRICTPQVVAIWTRQMEENVLYFIQNSDVLSMGVLI